MSRSGSSISLIVLQTNMASRFPPAKRQSVCSLDVKLRPEIWVRALTETDPYLRRALWDLGVDTDRDSAALVSDLLGDSDGQEVVFKKVWTLMPAHLRTPQVRTDVSSATAQLRTVASGIRPSSAFSSAVQLN